MLAGLGLVIASGCVFNNIIDRDIDQKMQRTMRRALVINIVSVKQACVFGSVLGVLGLLTLLITTNLLAVTIAGLGFIFYVGIYTPSKRRTLYATHIGSISGAIPPAVGYVSVTNKLTLTALLLFAVLATWQMPHFFAIAMYRLKEYRAARIPVLPALRGARQTQIQIISYITLFIFFCILLGIQAFDNALFIVVMVSTGLIWLVISLKGLGKVNEILWAKKMFGVSLLVLLIFCGVIFTDAFLSLAVYSNN